LLKYSHDRKLKELTRKHQQEKLALEARVESLHNNFLNIEIENREYINENNLLRKKLSDIAQYKKDDPEI